LQVTLAACAGGWVAVGGWTVGASVVAGGWEAVGCSVSVAADTVTGGSVVLVGGVLVVEIVQASISIPRHKRKMIGRFMVLLLSQYYMPYSINIFMICMKSPKMGEAGKPNKSYNTCELLDIPLGVHGWLIGALQVETWLLRYDFYQKEPL
jgi:hypothetical protein